MADNLLPLKDILIDFQKRIETRKEISKLVRSSGNFDTDEDLDYWTKEEAYVWINAEVYYQRIKQEHKKLDIPECFFEPATKFYEEWMLEITDLQNTENCLIKPPTQKQSLLEYLHRLYHQSLNTKKLSLRWKLSLRSFCNYIRKSYISDEPGFLNIIFPPKMDFKYGHVIRKIPIEVYPIDIIDAKALLKQFSDSTLTGRSTTQHSSAEILALSWLALVCAREKTLSQEELLHTINSTHLKVEKTVKEKILYGKTDSYSDLETYYLYLPTLFFEEKIRISKTMYEYLSALYAINKGKLFSRSLRSLRNTLHTNISKTKLSANPEEISFLTFFSQPHGAIGFRYKPKKDEIATT